MQFLVRPNTYSKYMQVMQMSNDAWTRLFMNPPVFDDKKRAPLAIFGTAVDKPEIDKESRRPRCTGSNVESLFALQLDYDSSMTIDRFCTQYGKFRWSLYTSYSYGFKPGDRFRVIVPLGAPLPCHLLQNRRVKANLGWHFPNVDTCCFDRGHWQILPAIRAKGAPYVHIKNDGQLWGNADMWGEYARWVREDEEEFARRKEQAQERIAEVNPEQLLHWMEEDLRQVPIGCGQRYNAVKRILAKYAHRGIADLLPGLPCPWSDKKWQKQWSSLTAWASTIC